MLGGGGGGGGILDPYCTCIHGEFCILFSLYYIYREGEACSHMSCLVQAKEVRPKSVCM